MRLSERPSDPNVLPWLALTRPGRVRHMVRGVEGDWWVGPEGGFVVWLFALEADRDLFWSYAGREIVRAGWIGERERDFRSLGE